MEQEELKRKLMGLWEKTTHTSKDLINNLFDFYFNINYIEYKESEGKVICALCGIPYFFGYGDKKLKGLYILALSSEEGYRKKGILAELLQKLNARMTDDVDFTFLVPSTALMADYFGTQAYFSSFFILEERFTPLHDFKNDYILSLTESDSRIKDLKIELLNELKVTDNADMNFSKDTVMKFLENIERKGSSSVNLCHSKKDWEYLLQNQTIKNINYFICYDSEQKVTGIAFTIKEDIKRIRIVASYVSDICSYYVLLDFIKHRYPDHSISINTFEPKYQTHSIIQQNYASENPDGGDLENSFSIVEIPFNINKLLQPMGMVRLLRFEKIFEFIAETRSDVDFKLHIRDYTPTGKKSEQIHNDKDQKSVFIIKNGKLSIDFVDNFNNNKSILNLTQKEVSELLLRKNDSSNLIMEAFGIPRLNLQIRLLPC